MSQTSLLRLMMLMSPSFPVGGFAYSAGLEQAVADRQVTDAQALEAWLEVALASGAAWNDAVFLKASHGAVEPLESLSGLAQVLAGSRQRHMETVKLGMAFAEAVKASGLPCPDLPNDVAYPVAVGAVALANAIEPEPALAAFLHGFVSNQIQCAIRLGITGQNGGVALLAKMEPVIAAAAAQAAQSTLDDLASNTILADIATMRHETLYSRIFRT